MTFRGDHHRGSFGIILAGSTGYLCFARCREELTQSGSRLKRRSIVLPVPAIAKVGVRNTAVCQHLFSRYVLRSQEELRVIEVEQACVSDEGNTGRGGCINNIRMLLNTLSNLARGNKYQPVNTTQSVSERLLILIARNRHRNATASQFLRLFFISHDSNDVTYCDTSSFKLINDQASKMTSRASNCNTHYSFSSIGGVYIKEYSTTKK